MAGTSAVHYHRATLFEGLHTHLLILIGGECRAGYAQEQLVVMYLPGRCHPWERLVGKLVGHKKGPGSLERWRSWQA